jgi:hypothetical protein
MAQTIIRITKFDRVSANWPKKGKKDHIHLKYGPAQISCGSTRTLPNAS